MPGPVKRYDVVIVGAGPVGATCTLALKDSSLRVAVLDQSTFPRDKVCGDAIPGRVPGVLRAIDPDLLHAFEQFERKQAIRRCRIVAPDGTGCVLHYSGSGYTSTRLDFDHFLFEQAQERTAADFYENTRVSHVEATDHHATVRTKAGPAFQAKLLIGGDGAHSVVARQLAGTRPDKAHYCGAVRAYFRDVAGMEPDCFEVFLPKGYLPGYFWIFPLPAGTVNVGFGMLSESISARSISLKQALPTIIEETPGLAERFRGAEQIGTTVGFGLPMGSRAVPLSGRRFLLAGDAAHLIDPTTGDGIGTGMQSALLAARHAENAFAAGDFSARQLAAYDRAVHREIKQELKRRYFIQRFVNDRAWLINFLIARAGSNSLVRRLVHKAI